MLSRKVNRLQLVARFAVDVIKDDQNAHAEIPEDTDFLCEHPLGNTQKIRALVRLADFMLDCQLLEVSTKREYFARSAMESERRKRDEAVMEDNDDETVGSTERRMESVLK